MNYNSQETFSGEEKIPCAKEGCTEVRIFTVRDQIFYEEKGFTKPKYCKTHSKERRSTYDEKKKVNQVEEARGNWDVDNRYNTLSDSEMLA